MTRRGWVMFASLCVMWGLPYMLIKIALQDLEPAAIVFLRCGLAAVILLPWAAITGRLAALRGHLRWVGLFAICEIGIPWMLTGVAEQHLSSSVTALLIAGVPLLTALIYRFTHLKEHLGIRRSLGLGLGSLGVGLLVGFSLSGSTGPAIAMMAAVILGYTLGPLIIAGKLSDLPGGAVVAVSVGLVAVALRTVGHRSVAPPRHCQRHMGHRDACDRVHSRGIPDVLRLGGGNRCPKGDRRHLHQPCGRSAPWRGFAVRSRDPIHAPRVPIRDRWKHPCHRQASADGGNTLSDQRSAISEVWRR